METPITRRLLDTAVEIGQQDEPDQLSFIHSILAQVGMPRRAQAERFFERTSGRATLRLEAGSIYQRGKFVQQALPYGAKPRLVLIHLSSEAVRTKKREIYVGDTTRQFLLTLGIDTNGGPRGGYTLFRPQMEALAACRLILGFSDDDHDVTINTQPISKFEAWKRIDGEHVAMWPGVMELSNEFFTTLLEHAVPLDSAALSAIKHSALALDVYTWLAHRLCRITKREGIKLSWANLQEQFGQEYNAMRSFKQEFLLVLAQVMAVYPDAKIDEVDGGLLLKPSAPPVSKKMVQQAQHPWSPWANQNELDQGKKGQK